MTKSCCRCVSHLLATKFAFLLMGVMMSIGCDRGGLPMAVYPDMHYIWHPDSETLTGFKSADLYIQWSNGQTFYVPNLTPDDVGNIFGWEEVKLTTPRYRLFQDGRNNFRFEKGSLERFTLCSDDEDPGRGPFLLSRHAEGPFLPMPKTKKELVALFGKPDHWTSYHPPTGP
jgi:hypothetical protein